MNRYLKSITSIKASLNLFIISLLKELFCVQKLVGMNIAKSPSNIFKYGETRNISSLLNNCRHSKIFFAIQIPSFPSGGESDAFTASCWTHKTTVLLFRGPAHTDTL